MEHPLGRAKKYVTEGLIGAAITAALGAVLLIWPEWAMRWLCFVLGVLLALAGGKHLRDYIRHRKQGFFLYVSLVLGVVLLGLGIWLLTNPEGLLRLVQYIFGAFVLFRGAADLRGALDLVERGRGSGRWIALGCAVLTVALGGVILFNPFEALRTLVMLVGGVLLFDGLSSLWTEWRLIRLGHGTVTEAIIETQGRDLDP